MFRSHVFFAVDAKAEIADLQNQITSLKEKNAILEKTNQHVRFSCIFLQNSFIVTIALCILIT